MQNARLFVEVGELVGSGRTSDVYAFGADSVIKVPHTTVPHDWPAFEAALTQAVCAEGVAAPRVRDVVDVAGRPSVVFERIDGPSMWQQMLAQPDQAAEHARTLARIQKELFSVGIPDGIPDLVDRLFRKISGATQLEAAEQAEAIALADALPRGAALLHGDLHPGNVLMRDDGPVVIDWFDACIGHPVADIVRSSILMQPGRAAAPRHLPGAGQSLLRAVHTAYLNEFRSDLEDARIELASWQAVMAAGRLSEGAEVDEGGLVTLWQSRFDDTATAALFVS